MGAFSSPILVNHFLLITRSGLNHINQRVLVSHWANKGNICTGCMVLFSLRIISVRLPVPAPASAVAISKGVASTALNTGLAVCADTAKASCCIGLLLYRSLMATYNANEKTFNKKFLVFRIYFNSLVVIVFRM